MNTVDTTLDSVSNNQMWNDPILADYLSISKDGHLYSALPVEGFAERGYYRVRLDEDAPAGHRYTQTHNTLVIDVCVIPDCVTSIADNAFCHVWASQIEIPASVTEISPRAFSKTNATTTNRLRTFKVSADNPAYKNLNGHLLTKDGETILVLASPYTGVLVIPAGVKSVGTQSVPAYGPYGYRTIFLPESIESFKLRLPGQPVLLICANHGPLYHELHKDHQLVSGPHFSIEGKLEFEYLAPDDVTPAQARRYPTRLVRCKTGEAPLVIPQLLGASPLRVIGAHAIQRSVPSVSMPASVVSIETSKPFHGCLITFEATGQKAFINSGAFMRCLIAQPADADLDALAADGKYTPINWAKYDKMLCLLSDHALRAELAYMRLSTDKNLLPKTALQFQEFIVEETPAFITRLIKTRDAQLLEDLYSYEVFTQDVIATTLEQLHAHGANDLIAQLMELSRNKQKENDRLLGGHIHKFDL